MSLPTPTLHTARLRLRPFDDADANGLFALHSNAYVLRYWDAPPWSERVRAERFITACRQMAQEGTGARLAVDRVCDGTFIGWCSLKRWNPDYRSASLSYCFDDAAWGHGYATEAARGLLRWAFDTLDLNRVQAETDTRNVASARVLEKLGFVREGTLREDCVVNGEISDSWVYGLIRREWRPSSEPGARPSIEQNVLVQTSYGLVPVGWVQSALRVPGDAPNQRNGAPRAWIRFNEQVAEGAKDLRPGDEIVVLTWLHLSPRDELSTHPQGDMSQPLTGVFSTRSPNRPNPIGLHRARIVARDGLRIEVDALEAIDGTPVVDVKPAIDPPA